MAVKKITIGGGTYDVNDARLPETSASDEKKLFQVNAAGNIALPKILEYGTPTKSAIKNAAAPMIGGIICPPVEAAASTAPANAGL